MALTGFVALAQFIGAIALLILLHEIGHFLAARLVGIQVEEFGLGYPPRAAKLFTWRGTIYSLNWLPLGGFVRMKGETDPDAPDSFLNANPWARLVVLIAGPAMNFLATAVLFAVIFVRLGSPDFSRVEILHVAPGSPAAMAELQSGDIVLKVDGEDIASTDALRNAIYANLGAPIELTYMRGDQTNTAVIVPRANPPEGQGAIGIIMGNPRAPIHPAEALFLGGAAVIEQSRNILSLPAQLISGTVSPEEGRLIGYKGMYDIYNELRETDLAPGAPEGISTLGFFASISLSLGLLNLLPIPALDGGRILFTLPEILFRRKIPPAYENMINLIGFALLILLFIYINVQDFVNPIQLP